MNFPHLQMYTTVLKLKGENCMEIRPYFIFKCGCQDAIELYKRAFETEVSEIMRFSDIPQSPDNPMTVPNYQKRWIVMAM